MAIEMYAIDQALQAIKAAINRAQQHQAQDIEYCKGYLDAASLAIEGLEREYDEILNQAANCDLSQPDQTQSLSTRIDNYLYVDKLRPELLKAVAGLLECRAALMQHSENILRWPWTNPNREQALFEFDELVERLGDYLLKLDREGFKYRKARTGIGVSSLEKIKDFIASKDLRQNANNGLRTVIDEIRQDRTKDNLLTYTLDIKTTFHHLEQAFR